MIVASRKRGRRAKPKMSTEDEIRRILKNPTFFDREYVANVLSGYSDLLDQAFEPSSALPALNLKKVVAAHSGVGKLKFLSAYVLGQSLRSHRGRDHWQQYVREEIGENQVVLANAAVDLAVWCDDFPKFWMISNMYWTYWRKNRTDVKEVWRNLSPTQQALFRCDAT